MARLGRPRRRRWLHLGPLIAGFALMPLSARAAGPEVRVAHLDGEINAVMAAYLGGVVARAEQAHDAALVVVCDTPGGVSTAMDGIVTSFLNSRVPVIVYVSPAGARADSAGLFAGQAAAVLAMAPGTNIGSAHPIDAGGANLGGDLREKVVNDSVARIRSLASSHGRNADWSEQAVRQSVNVGAEEAVRLHVADVMSPSLGALLDALDQRTALVAGSTATLNTGGARLVDDSMSPLQAILHALMDPTAAYLLMLVAVYGLITELTHPGLVLPGTAGAIAAVLAVFALSGLPVTIAGALLLLVALTLLVVDLKAQTHGVLTVGGVIALAFGSALFFDTGQVDSGVHPAVIAAVALVTAGFFAIVLARVVAARRRPPAALLAGTLDGLVGVARDDLAPAGMVHVGGALWSAVSDNGPIERDTPVRVLSRRGLTLVVAPAAPAATARAKEN